MNTNLLRSWLSLPPGPWPPDQRELLGLPAGGTPTPAEVEDRALARMDALRPHQLLHPDLVTEGMNRLAQAMIALTDAPKLPPAPPPKAKSSLIVPAKPEPPKAERPKPAAPPKPRSEPKPVPPPPPVFEADEIILDVSKPAPKPKSRRDEAADIVLDASELVPPPAAAKPEVFDAEVILDAPTVPNPPEAESKPIPRPMPVVRDAVAVVEAEPKSVPIGAKRADRRDAYRELVATRKLLRAWEKLQPFVGVPSEPLASPGDVFGFVLGVRTCRLELSRPGGLDLLPRHGRLVAAVVRNPLTLPLFRDLQPTQRQTLAIDWARSTGELRARLIALRTSLRDGRPTRSFGRPVRLAVVGLKRNPEWLLVVLIALALVLAVVRRPAARPEPTGVGGRGKVLDTTRCPA